MSFNSRKNLNFENLESRLLLSYWFKPQIKSQAQYLIKEDTKSSINVRVWDMDSKNLTVGLRVTNGKLDFTGNHKVSVDFKNNGLIARGQKEDINKFFKFVTYEPKKDSNKQETLTINAFDGKHRSISTSKINIIPVNDAPSISTSDIVFSKNNNVVWDKLFHDPDSKNISVSLNSSSSIYINDSSVVVKNLGNKIQLRGELSKINKIFSTLGAFKIQPSDKKDIQLTITVSDGRVIANKTIFISHKETLIENATNAISSRIMNKDAYIAKDIFSIMDHENSIYTRNTNSWVYDLDLTSISPWNSAGANRMAGTLVSPRHIVYATHYQLPIGSKIRFVTKDNVVVEKTLVNKISQKMTGVYFPDITVGLLDSDVPETINFAKILPETFNQYMVDLGIDNKIPSLALDQQEKALITGLFALQDYAIFDGYSSTHSYGGFFEQIIAGDSGNPAFLVINNELVLITVWTFGHGGSGTFITNQKNSINKIMKDLGGEYQLTEIDLSDFKKVS